MSFAGKRALVTGAASGIGLATARRLAADDAALVMTDIDAAALEAVDLHGEKPVGDVADEAFWDGLDLGSLDLAVINAGISSSGPIAELDFTEWRRVLRVNLDGAFLSLRAAMRASRDGASIVLVASAAGVKAEPGVGAYGASKAGVIQLARVSAKEGAPRGIRVNAIAPGGVETPIWREMPFFRDMIAEHGSEAAAFAALAGLATPLGRYATADEIAAQIAFLLSGAAATITGALLLSDGGYTL